MLIFANPEQLGKTCRRIIPRSGNPVKFFVANLCRNRIPLLHSTLIRSNQCRAQNLPILSQKDSSHHMPAEADTDHCPWINAIQKLPCRMANCFVPILRFLFYVIFSLIPGRIAGNHTFFQVPLNSK